MATTTLRIEDRLKARVAVTAERSGKKAHAFMLEAIEQIVEQAELDEEFQRLADDRWAKLLATGKTVPWDEAKVWLAPEVLEDFDRFLDHMASFNTPDVSAPIQEIVQG